jgi:hypothetical protein
MFREDPIFKKAYQHPAEKVRDSEYSGEINGVKFSGVKRKASWTTGEAKGKWNSDHGKFEDVNEDGYHTHGKYGQEYGHYSYNHKGKDGSEYSSQSYSSSSYESTSTHN